jgi:prophage tail gpP-like protein
VNGRDYSGWKSVRVTRGIEAISGSFELEIAERWAGQDLLWPLEEEDHCQVLIGDKAVITGFVDSAGISYGAQEHTFSVAGRDLAGAMVDCSAALKHWEWLNVGVLELARHLAEPFGIKVSMQPGLQEPWRIPKVAVDPGDTAFDALERACRLAGVLPISDGAGGVLLTRAGAARATTALVEGVNILGASADFDASGRFRRYIVMGQQQGTDHVAGADAAWVRAEAEDLGVVRSSRVLIVRAEGNVTPASAKLRAEWEAKVRAARATGVTVVVQGWTQADGTPDGTLWPVNARVPIRSKLLGLDGEMLITQAMHTLDEHSGALTHLSLKRPDAFLPEPVIAEEEPSAAHYPELSRGV